MSPHAAERLGRVGVAGIGAMLACLIVGAGVAHRVGQSTEIPQSSVVSQRDLVFQDQPDGAITVWDAGTHKLVAQITGQAGFLRQTVRGLAMQRKREDDDQKTPFRLIAWADGRLTLDDPVTERHVELECFGETNERVFADLLGTREVGG